MLKKNVSLFLVWAVILLSNSHIIAQTQKVQNSENESLSSSVLKDSVSKHLQKLKSKDSFTEADAKKFEKESLNQTTKKSNFSTTAKIGIGIGIALGVALAIFLATRNNDDDNQSGVIYCGTIQAPCP